MPRTSWRAAALAGATAVAAGSGAGGASWLTYTYLMRQATAARGVIGRTWARPPEADGVYPPGAQSPVPWRRGVPFDLHLMIFGDSTAAGLGCVSAAEVPGVLLARALADESGRSVRLDTKAIAGATSRGLAGQVDAMFVAGPPPDAAVILVGANDVTAKLSLHRSAQRLGSAVRRLRTSGAAVVVGTCPDLGVVGAIPQPLRTVVRTWGRQLARAQAAATRAAGGYPVPLADLLTPEFLSAPDRLFSADGFHPSAAGYELAAGHLLPVLAAALGLWAGGPVPAPPQTSAAARLWLPRTRRGPRERVFPGPAVGTVAGELG
ncbi:MULTISPECIES: SGNH/GDSL hydrolase family protein [Rhodococcus]|nr:MULTISPECIES: SGNH/GDSL hydrolase family protein [Rhodococcus]ATQ31269.1 GDSL family lipase [Rhodococcus ruber]AUM16102.1 SGNH/GDSL hydrolase family protein [Rhodococcus ruber]AWG98210.1 SGNH/GDSL hydrolase family protein [Rhodococcus ruber]MBD8052635.1 SGNH/GDSL hydrolase family protein [Rhodococcus ruber]UIR37351.1 SGNH/GDSL hydrolase family protein [Rhodococcus sp. DMF-1]